MPVGVYVTGSESADVRWLNGSDKVSGACDSADRPVSGRWPESGDPGGRQPAVPQREPLGAAAEDVRRTLSRLLRLGPASTESDCDCDALFPALAEAALPFGNALRATSMGPDLSTTPGPTRPHLAGERLSAWRPSGSPAAIPCSCS